MEEQKLLNEWKNDNLIIGYINGDFDTIKLEYVQILKYASQHCDKLIVGLDTDYAIKLKHCINMPKNNYIHRKQMLEALEYADMIIPIEEINSYNVIDSVKPDKIFMNSDHKDYDMIKQLVESYNGELVNTDSVYMNEQEFVEKEKAIITGFDHVLVDLSTKTPNYNNLYLMNALHKEGYKILVVTCKSESERKEIENWLEKYIDIEKLYMRANSITNTAKIKEEIYNKYIESKYDIDFVFDSDEDNCEMWVKHNLNCMHVLS